MDINDLFNKDMISFDVESTGVHMRTDVPLGFGVASSQSEGFYVPVEDQYYCQLLNDPTKTYIAFNAKFDRAMMKKAGVIIDNLCDPMIAAHLCEENGLSLAGLILNKTGRTIRQFSELTKPLQAMSYEELTEYAGRHARAGWVLWNGYQDDRYDWPGYKTELKRNILWDLFWKLEMPFTPVLSDMELAGVGVDKEYLRELGAYFDEKIEILENVLSFWGDKYGIKVNFNSPDQAADLFYSKLKIKQPWRRTSSGRPALEASYLTSIKDTHPIIPWYLEYKHFQKLKGTYVNALLRDMVDGRIYGSFNQTGTRTSRLSSTDPNLQNIPLRTEEGRKIRRAFVASEGHSLVKVDADQLELKMMAHWSKDKFMLDAFRSGRDIHIETALRAYGDAEERRKAKTLNYQIQYGGGDEKNKAAFYNAYPGVLSWTERTQSEARELGYVRTLFKRKRTLPEIKSTYGKEREHGEREAISTIIQGSSAEVVKIGMTRVWGDTKNNSEIEGVLQVHDEAVYEVADKIVDEFAHYVSPRMRYDELEVPITYTVSVGKNWGQMVELSKN